MHILRVLAVFTLGAYTGTTLVFLYELSQVLPRQGEIIATPRQQLAAGIAILMVYLFVGIGCVKAMDTNDVGDKGEAAECADKHEMNTEYYEGLSDE